MQDLEIEISDILAFVDDFAPEEAAEHLARLDDRLLHIVFRTPASSQQQAVRGMAYRLLKDALARRAAGRFLHPDTGERFADFAN